MLICIISPHVKKYLFDRVKNVNIVVIWTPNNSLDLS